MPKETSIGVSEETLKFLKEYKKEFGAKSLDEAIQNAVQWARLWYTVDYLKRKELTQRVSDLELQVAKLTEALKNTNKIKGE